MNERTNGAGAEHTAQYIERISKELRGLANRAELGFLAYLLDMVQQEAGTIARGGAPGSTAGPDGKPDRPPD